VGFLPTIHPGDEPTSREVTPPRSALQHGPIQGSGITIAQDPADVEHWLRFDDCPRLATNVATVARPWGSRTKAPNLWRDWLQKNARLATNGDPAKAPHLWRDWLLQRRPISGEIGYKKTRDWLQTWHGPQMQTALSYFSWILKVLAPSLTVVVIPEVLGSKYFLGTSTNLGSSPLPFVAAMIFPVAMPRPASVLTAI
jgi:hypothetical protein